MKSVSIIAAAAVMLASSVNAASNDPRECEGEFKFFETKIGFYCNNSNNILGCSGEKNVPIDHFYFCSNVLTRIDQQYTNKLLY